MENDKLSIESPMMSQHTLYAHAKKLEAMIQRLADKLGHDLKNDMFSLERAFNFEQGMPSQVENEKPQGESSAENEQPQIESSGPSESVESSEPHSNS